MFRRSVPCIVALLLALGGCGGQGGGGSAAPSGADAKASADAAPELSRRPARAGEIVVRGEASPKAHGPLTFGGRYVVRFEQYAPEDPRLDFASQVPFTASLTRREGDPRGATELFTSAVGSGRRELTIRGRLYVDVSFGDFPYVIRFTPTSG